MAGFLVMEEADDHQWMKRKDGHDGLLMKSSEYFKAVSSSWEEKAFAEDHASAGSIGGCIWPPRSYSCSFCMREFRSAQALGGHMNIHRRDRARLKQCPISPNTTTSSDHHHQNDHNVHDRHPNSSIITSSEDHHRQTAVITTNNSEYYFEPCLENSNYNYFSRGETSYSISTRCVGGDGDGDDNCVKTDLCVGLNSVVSRINGPKPAEVLPVLELLFKPMSSCHLLQSDQVMDQVKAAASMDDLDLELRLGELPKVK